MFQGPKCLSELKLSFNVISFIENSAFEHQKCLRELQLDSNNLTTITQFTFLGLKRLVSIWLQNNKIHTINPNSFLLMPCSSLFLELSNNRLASLKWNVFRDEYSCFHRNYWQTLKLNLDGNNMSCSSDTCWIEGGIKQGSIILSPTEEGSFASQQCRISCPTAGCQVSFQKFDHNSWAFSFHKNITHRLEVIIYVANFVFSQWQISFPVAYRLIKKFTYIRNTIIIISC